MVWKMHAKVGKMGLNVARILENVAMKLRLDATLKADLRIRVSNICIEVENVARIMRLEV